MRRTRHVVLPVRSWQYIGLMLVSLACLTLGHVSRDREGRSGSLTGPEMKHTAPHEVDACPNEHPFALKPAANLMLDQKTPLTDSYSQLDHLYLKNNERKSVSLTRNRLAMQRNSRSTVEARKLSQSNDRSIRNSRVRSQIDNRRSVSIDRRIPNDFQTRRLSDQRENERSRLERRIRDRSSERDNRENRLITRRLNSRSTDRIVLDRTTDQLVQSARESRDRRSSEQRNVRINSLERAQERRQNRNQERRQHSDRRESTERRQQEVEQRQRLKKRETAERRQGEVERRRILQKRENESLERRQRQVERSSSSEKRENENLERRQRQERIVEQASSRLDTYLQEQKSQRSTARHLSRSLVRFSNSNTHEKARINSRREIRSIRSISVDTDKNRRLARDISNDRRIMFDRRQSQLEKRVDHTNRINERTNHFNERTTNYLMSVPKLSNKMNKLADVGQNEFLRQTFILALYAIYTATLVQGKVGFVRGIMNQVNQFSVF